MLAANEPSTITRWVESIQRAIQSQSSNIQMPVDNGEFLIRESVVNVSTGVGGALQPLPFVLHLSVLRALSPSFNVTSSCYVKILARSKFFGKTGVQVRSKAPVWREHFSLPLTHLKQGQLCLELWDSNVGADALLGTARVDFVDVPLSSPVVEKECPLVDASGRAMPAFIVISLFVEERKDIISLVPDESVAVAGTAMHAVPAAEQALASLDTFICRESAQIHASGNILKAFHAAELLPVFDSSDFCLVRDLLYDTANMFPSTVGEVLCGGVVGDEDGDGGEEEEDYDDDEMTGGPHALPMAAHPIADNVGVIKPTDILFGACSQEPESAFNRADCSFCIKTKQCEVVFVAPNQYVVFLWVREIRRQCALRIPTKAHECCEASPQKD
jgi:hypothetical protein